MTSSPPSSTRWAGIAAALRDDIRSGRCASGARLPSEAELATRFRVNRHTVRQALQALASEGLVRARQGSGTFVCERLLAHVLSRRTRLGLSLAEAGEVARRELLAHVERPAPEWASGPQGLNCARVTQLESRAWLRERVISLSRSAFPLPRLAGIAEAFERSGSVTAALADLGVADYTRERSTISARLPSAAEAQALGRLPSEPVLVVDYRNLDLGGLPVEVGQTVFAADAVQLAVHAQGWEPA